MHGIQNFFGPEMVVSASTNQVWTKITIGSYAHVFPIQNQIQAVWYIYSMSSICGEFKFASENNYRKFLETMGAPSGMIDNIMASLENVINQIF